MNGEHQDRVAAVTGAGRGIGAGIAARLAEDGFHVALIDIDETTVGHAADAIGRDWATPYVVDLAKRQDVLDVFSEIAQTHGRIDAVVNNAMWVHYSPLIEMDEQSLDAMWTIGLKAAFWTIQGAYPAMIAQDSGVVVNMSSPAATRGIDGSSGYSAVKGAVSSLTWQAARELGPQGIRVNGIIPGAVDTPGARRVVDDEGYETRRKMSTLGRLATAEDIAAGVSFLVSPDAAYVNGHILNVDGAL